MSANCYKLYAKIDKKTGEYEFVGTMKELSEYTGLPDINIRSYMSHCAKANKFCPYVLVGNVENEEEKKERKREYARKHMKESYQKKKEKMLREIFG